MTYRKAHWDKIYTEKSPLEVSWYQKEPVLSLRLIQNTKIDKNLPIIDIGGGTSILVDRLIDEGYTNIGILDISANALSFAKKRLDEKAM
ncbi:MAG: hypothetical protein ACXACY_29845 [Candidatus Hodarchaeales archaeon]|jgi:ubiquinone/menaquinone biosynthesis C-methylase UbiE